MLSLIQYWDSTILIFIQDNLRTSFLTPINIFLSTIGEAGIFWIIISLALIIYPKTRRIGLFALTSLAFCFVINNLLLKNIVDRPRPYTRLTELIMLMRCPSDSSFPSGHSCSSFATANAIRLCCKNKYRWMAVVFPIIALGIALSRLYVGVHYPSDVIVGIFIGTFFSWLLFKLLHTKFFHDTL